MNKRMPTIALVDDDRNILTTLSIALQAEGFATRVYADGETALKALDEGVRAVVILDGRVPNACLLELFTEHGAGSLIRSTEPRVKPRGLRQGDSGL